MKLKFGGKSKLDLFQELSNRKIAFNSYAIKLFMSEYFKVSARERVVDLKIISPRDMGYLDGATFQDLTQSAIMSGLDYCTLEMAVYLRIQYNETPSDEDYLTVASRLSNDNTVPNGFYLRSYDNNQWLRGYVASPDVVYNSDKRFVFLGEFT